MLAPPLTLPVMPRAERQKAATPTRPAVATADHARTFVADHRKQAATLGRGLAQYVGDPADLAAALRRALMKLADPIYRTGQAFVAPGIGATHGVRNPLLQALGRGFRSATRADSPTSLLLAADRLLREPELEAHWFAFGILEATLPRETERSWQVIRHAGREARDWITVDALAHTIGRGVLAEPFRWAELEQLVYAPSRWERRLVGSTIATIPFVDRTTGRDPEVAARGLAILGLLIGDSEPDVQKALAWAYRSMALVDLASTTDALRLQADRAKRDGDGHRAWVIRDVLAKLDPEPAAAMRQTLNGLRRRPGASSTSEAAAIAARFTDLGLGRPMPEPPLT